VAYKGHIEDQDVLRWHIRCSALKIENITQHAEVVLYQLQVLPIASLIMNELE